MQNNLFRFVLLSLFLLLVPRAYAFDHDYHEKINGTKLHFRVRGENVKNPYLLILHGGPGFSAHMFYPWGKSIEKAVNVVYLDQRGCGESQRPTTPPTDAQIKAYTLHQLLLDIESVRRFLKIQQWYVLGHSWGGMLGLEYVTAYPDAVLGYLHVDGLLSQPMAQASILTFADEQIKEDTVSSDAHTKERAGRLKAFLAYAGKQPPGPPRLYASMQLAMALFDSMYYADPKKNTAYRAAITKSLAAYHLPLTVKMPASEPGTALIQNDHYATRDETGLLAKVTCKTVVINGREDHLIPVETAETVQKGIPGAQLVILDSCGHFPFAEQPEKFTKAVLQFVTP